MKREVWKATAHGSTFAAVRHLIRADARETFSFERRSRRPPLDRFNALISFPLYATGS